MPEEQDRDLQALKKDMEQVRKDVAELGKSVKGMAKQKASRAKATVEQELDRAVSEVRERGAKTVAALEREVEQRPLTTLIAAFGIGFVLGKLLDRR